jgi:hypothetical protein
LQLIRGCGICRFWRSDPDPVSTPSAGD